MISIRKPRFNQIASLAVAFLAAVPAYICFMASALAGGGSYTMMVGNLTVVVANSVIAVTGTAGPDVIHLTQDAKGNVYLLNPLTGAYILIGINPAQIQAIGLQGADYIQLDITSFPTLARGGPDSDVIFCALGKALCQAYGDLAADALILRGGNTQAWGGGGSDNFTQGPPWTSQTEYVPIWDYVIDSNGDVEPIFIGEKAVTVPVYSIIEDFTKSDNDSKNDPSNPGWAQQVIH